jgi:diaminopimelate epimerase
VKLRFTKMHGQGNDFVMLNAIAQPHASRLAAEQIRFIADRHFGVGCDQVLLAESALDAANDFRYRIFNASGEEVEHCGNGSRCFPLFVRDEGLTNKQSLAVETLSGIIRPRIDDDDQAVTVDMGAPRFSPTDIPFDAPQHAAQYALHVDGAVVSIGALSMGNPHAVQVVPDVDSAPVTTQGPRIEHHVLFPKRVNVGFMQVLARNEIRLRVWERGAGETLACGTGACAAVVTGIRWGLLDGTVRVITRGGELSVTWNGTENLAAPVLMSGTATFVYRGEIDLPV